MEDGYTVYSKHKLYPKPYEINWQSIILWSIYLGLFVGLFVFWLMQQNPEWFTWLK